MVFELLFTLSPKIPSIFFEKINDKLTFSLTTRYFLVLCQVNGQRTSITFYTHFP